MTKKLYLIALAATLSSLTPCRAEDSVRAFLKIDGIAGEATNNKHLGEIDIAAFKLGVMQSLTSSTGGGGGAGKATFGPVVVFKGIDSASPLLFLHCATGQHHPQAVLTLSEQGKDYFIVRLVDVVIGSCDVNSNNLENSELPLETVSLNYAKIEITYQPITPKGTPGAPITVGFDVLGNVTTVK